MITKNSKKGVQKGVQKSVFILISAKKLAK